MKFYKKTLLPLIVICISLLLSGCTNTAAESYSQNNITQSSSTKTKSNKNNDKKEETAEIKNIEPSEDVFKDFFNDVEINGIKLSLPCSYDELSKCFELQKPKYATDYYHEEIEKYCYLYEFRYKDESNLIISAEYRSKYNENKIKSEDMYNFFVASDLTGNNACLFRLGEINNYSDMTKNDVEEILGKPNEDTLFSSWYKYNNSNDIVIHYNKNGYVDYINCFWKEKENNNEQSNRT